MKTVGTKLWAAADSHCLAVITKDIGNLIIIIIIYYLLTAKHNYLGLSISFFNMQNNVYKSIIFTESIIIYGKKSNR